MDDFGAETISNFGFEKLFIIINHRAENGLHLVVTTNLALDNIPGDKEHRLASRLLRHRAGRVIEIDAPEYSVYKGNRKSGV